MRLRRHNNTVPAVSGAIPVPLSRTAMRQTPCRAALAEFAILRLMRHGSNCPMTASQWLQVWRELSA